MGCLQSLVSLGTVAADGNDLAILDRYRGDTASKDGWRRYDYQLENIAFSGGGVKGFAYIGAMQVGEPRRRLYLSPHGRVLAVRTQSTCIAGFVHVNPLVPTPAHSPRLRERRRPRSVGVHSPVTS